MSSGELGDKERTLSGCRQTHKQDSAEIVAKQMTGN